MIAQRKIKFLGVGIILLSLILSFVVYTSTKTTLELSKELHKDCPSQPMFALTTEVYRQNPRLGLLLWHYCLDLVLT